MEMSDNSYVENESSRPHTDEFLDLENGLGRGSSADQNEVLHPLPGHQISDTRPKLIQRSVTPKKAIARN